MLLTVAEKGAVQVVLCRHHDSYWSTTVGTKTQMKSFFLRNWFLAWSLERAMDRDVS